MEHTRDSYHRKSIITPSPLNAPERRRKTTDQINDTDNVYSVLLHPRLIISYQNRFNLLKNISLSGINSCLHGQTNRQQNKQKPDIN